MADKTVVVSFKARTGQYLTKVSQLSGATKRMANDQSAAMARANSRMKGVAAVSILAGKAVIVGVGGALAVSAKAAIDFESALAGVAKTVKGSDAEISRLGQAMRDLALTTPVSVTELLKIAEVGGQLGVPISKMEDFTRVVAALGVTTDLSSEQAAKSLARFANVMGSSFDDFEMLGSILVELGNSFATSESEILTFALRLAPIGAVIGATEAEVLGLAAAFSQLGIPAERGATAIQRTFIDIEKAVVGGGKKLADFAEVAGKSVEGFTRLSATEQLVSFIQGLGRIQRVGGSAVATLLELDIRQQRTISTLLAAAAAGDQFVDALRTANTEADESDALFEEAAKRYGTTASEIRLMANAFTDLRIEVGEEVIPTIRWAVQFLTDLFVGVKENTDAFKGWGKVLAVATGVSVLGGIIFGIGKLVSSLLALKTALKLSSTAVGLFGGALGLSLGAIGLAVTALGFLAVKSANVARRQRELAEAATLANDSLEAGEDPLTVWSDALKNELGPEKWEKVTDALRHQGQSYWDLIRAMQGGLDPLNSWGVGIRELAEGASQAAATLARDLGAEGVARSIEALLGEGPLTTRRLEDIIAMIENLQNVATTDLDPANLKNYLFLLGVYDELITFTSDFGGTLEADLERRLFLAAEGAAELANAMEIVRFRARRASDDLRLLQASLTPEGRLFEELADTEQLEKYLEFVAGIGGQVGESMFDLRDNLSERFAEIEQELINAVEPWEEFEAETELKLGDVVKSMRSQVDAIIGIERLLTDSSFDMSENVEEHFRSLPLSTQAGLLAMARGNEEQRRAFAEWVDDMDFEFERLSGLARSKFQKEVPDIINDALSGLIANLQESVGDFELSGTSAIVAYQSAIAAAMLELPAELRPSFQAIIDFLEEQNPDWFRSGGALGESLTDGIDKSIEKWVVRTSGMRASAATLRNSMDTVIRKEFQSRSPSKVAERWGTDIMAGFQSGLLGGFGDLLQGPFKRSIFDLRPPLTSAGPSVVNHGDSVRSFQFNVERATSSDFRRDSQALMAMMGLVEEMERPSGPLLR
jgi:TP901 family phage tail tape measure protein